RQPRQRACRRRARRGRTGAGRACGRRGAGRAVGRAAGGTCPGSGACSDDGARPGYRGCPGGGGGEPGMTEITATMVKQLRDATSAGMMDCKRALQETEGDFDEAVKLLREKGMASAAKRADRATSEGKVGVIVRGETGAIAAIGCETEPVSNND